MRDPQHSGRPVSRFRTWTRRFLLLGAGFLLAAACVELLVGLVYGTQVRFPRRVVEAPWGLRYNDPGAHYTHTSPDVTVSFRINAQGMRSDVDYPHEKPAGRRRIVCVGDSFTIGYEVESDQCFAKVLEAKLRADGIDVEVLNAGVSGYSTAEAVLYVERELLEYAPDVIVASFFINDLVDNVRSDLFRLDGDRLLQQREVYVPLGGIGNFLNSNFLFNFLSEHSNAFVFVKENITRVLKSELAQRNLENLERAADPSSRSSVQDYERRLAAALLRRLRDVCSSRAIPLVVQVIPGVHGVGATTLDDPFPYELFEPGDAGMIVICCKEFLQPLMAANQLYYERSHWHWTPISHAASGQKLASVIAPMLR